MQSYQETCRAVTTCRNATMIFACEPLLSTKTLGRHDPYEVNETARQDDDNEQPP